MELPGLLPAFSVGSWPKLRIGEVAKVELRILSMLYSQLKAFRILLKERRKNLMIIIQIILTIVAIIRGHKWFIAMLPLVIAFIIGVLMGMAGSSGRTPANTMMDILCIMILFAMCYFNPKKEEDKKVE